MSEIKTTNLYIKDYLAVLEVSDYYDIDKLSAILNALCSYYAFILHDSDFNDSGELKRPHFHLVMKLRKRTRFQTLLNELSNLLDIPLNTIQLDKVINFGLSVQYLIHLNDSNKYQYPPFLVYSNNKDYTDDLLTNGDNPTLTTSKLMEYIDNDKLNRKQLLYKIGLGNFTKYYRVIDMLYRLNGFNLNDNEEK